MDDNQKMFSEALVFYARPFLKNKPVLKVLVKNLHTRETVLLRYNSNSIEVICKVENDLGTFMIEVKEVGIYAAYAVNDKKENLELCFFIIQSSDCLAYSFSYLEDGKEVTEYFNCVWDKQTRRKYLNEKNITGVWGIEINMEMFTFLFKFFEHEGDYPFIATILKTYLSELFDIDEEIAIRYFIESSQSLNEVISKRSSKNVNDDIIMELQKIAAIVSSVISNENHRLAEEDAGPDPYGHEESLINKEMVSDGLKAFYENESGLRPDDPDSW
jgi:hypothetical protein